MDFLFHLAGGWRFHIGTERYIRLKPFASILMTVEIVRITPALLFLHISALSSTIQYTIYLALHFIRAYSGCESELPANNIELFAVYVM